MQAVTRGIFSLALLITLFAWQPPAHADPQLDLDQYRGKVVYLDFWASWCKPCRKSFPWMNDMLARHAKDGLVIVSVNVDSDRELATRFLAEVPANFPVIYDSQGELAASYELLGMPSSFIFDRNGKLVAAHKGFKENKVVLYERAIETVLQNQERARPTE